MNFTHLKYLIEVADSGSINKAASKLFISQSVLSNAIRKLETNFGKPLFVRTTKGVKPTPFGAEIIAFAKPLCRQIEQLNSIANRRITRPNVSLSVASAGFYFLSDALSQLYQRHSKVGIRIDSHECSIDEMKTLVTNRTAELGLMRRWSCYRDTSIKQLKSLNMRFSTIVSLDVGITVGPCNPLFYSESSHVTADQLQDYPSIMYCYMETGPYSDIYQRLRLPVSSNSMFTLSRATVYELLGMTDAYQLNSVYTSDPLLPNNHPSLPYPQRTLILSNCDVKSEIGWIKLNHHGLSPLAIELMEMIEDHLTASIY